MKMTTGILGCALVAGLMTFAADKAQAGVVIGGQLYSPLTLKLTASVVKDGKIIKKSATAKDILKILAYDKKDMLAVSRNSGDVWVINKDGLVADLSTNGTLTVSAHSIVSASKGGTSVEAGTTEVIFYSGGSAAGIDSANWFDITGVYFWKDVDGKVSKGFYLDNETYSAPGLSGSGSFTDLGPVPVAGSASAKGSGKLPAIL